MSNRAIAKELGVDEATIRNDLKALAMPAGERKKPGRPREWRPRYDPSDPESREKYKAAAMKALLVWFKDQRVSRPYLQQLLEIVPRRNYFKGIDSLVPCLPVRRFDELSPDAPASRERSVDRVHHPLVPTLVLCKTAGSRDEERGSTRSASSLDLRRIE
jgi:hypothetical protein